MKTYITPTLTAKGDAIVLTRNVVGPQDDLSGTPPYDGMNVAGSHGFFFL